MICNRDTKNVTYWFPYVWNYSNRVADTMYYLIVRTAI